MNIEKISVFKDTAITTLSEYISNTPLSKTNEYLDNLSREETILYQKQQTNMKRLQRMEMLGDSDDKIAAFRNDIIAFHRYYSYKEIIEVDALLNFHEILENLKHSKYLVQCTHLLHKYLYSSYTLSNFFQNDTKKEIAPITHIDINTPIFYGDSILPIWDEYKDANRVGSIENHFKNFFELATNSNDAREFTLIRTVQRKSSHGTHTYNPKYYLPVNQIPEFLFSFLFYDGRDFPVTYGANDKNRLPKRSKEKKFELVASEPKYKFVLKQIYSFYQNEFSSKKDIVGNYERRNAEINYKNKLDKLYRHNTLEVLYHYSKLYSSDIFLDHIMSAFSLSYKETRKLDEYIIHCIFEDTNFIKEGLRSPLRDFLLPFDIHFQYMLLSNSYLKGISGLESVIAECKTYAQEIWKITPSYNLKEKIFNDITNTGQNITLNIEELQNHIISILENNDFYKVYFSPENKFWISYINSPDELQRPISYQTLKEVLIPQ